jgi:hypothetical protein
MFALLGNMGDRVKKKDEIVLNPRLFGAVPEKFASKTT